VLTSRATTVTAKTYRIPCAQRITARLLVARKAVAGKSVGEDARRLLFFGDEARLVEQEKKSGFAPSCLRFSTTGHGLERATTLANQRTSSKALHPCGDRLSWRSCGSEKERQDESCLSPLSVTGLV
jgi:hypothetical protein